MRPAHHQERTTIILPLRSPRPDSAGPRQQAPGNRCRTPMMASARGQVAVEHCAKSQTRGASCAPLQDVAEKPLPGRRVKDRTWRSDSDRPSPLGSTTNLRNWRNAPSPRRPAPPHSSRTPPYSPHHPHPYVLYLSPAHCRNRHSPDHRRGSRIPSPTGGDRAVRGKDGGPPRTAGTSMGDEGRQGLERMHQPVSDDPSDHPRPQGTAADAHGACDKADAVPAPTRVCTRLQAILESRRPPTVARQSAGRHTSAPAHLGSRQRGNAFRQQRLQFGTAVTQEHRPLLRRERHQQVVEGEAVLLKGLPDAAEQLEIRVALVRPLHGRGHRLRAQPQLLLGGMQPAGTWRIDSRSRAETRRTPTVTAANAIAEGADDCQGSAHFFSLPA